MLLRRWSAWHISPNFFLFLFSASSTVFASQASSSVLELNEKFTQVMNEGFWFVEFYAPWCAHCKRLQPIWEQVGHRLADAQSQVRVARLDCTRFPSVASALEIAGYPTVIFFRNGEHFRYEGDRKKDAMVDYAEKISGPVVTMVEENRNQDSTWLAELRKTNGAMPFFVRFEDSDTSEETAEYEQIAGKLFHLTRFYRIRLPSANETMPAGTITSPSIVVYKENARTVFQPDKDGNLSNWIQSERWPLVPQVNPANIHDIGDCCGKLLVLAVLDMVERRNDTTDIGRFYGIFKKSAEIVRKDDELRNKFQFGWLDGSEMANSITLGTVMAPDFFVFNLSRYEFYRTADSSTRITEKALVDFLQRILSGKVEAQGGRSIVQSLICFESATLIVSPYYYMYQYEFFFRIRRMVYEITTNLYEMFTTQPLLTCCLFGVPIGFMAILCYSMCSTDFTVDREEIYPNSEGELSGMASLCNQFLQIATMNMKRWID